MPITDVAWAINDLTRRAPALQTRRDYYEGRHRPTVPEGRTLSRLMTDLLRDLSDNVCDDVVDEPVDRLGIIGWHSTLAEAAEVEDDEEEAAREVQEDVLGDRATEWWEANRGDSRLRDLLRGMFRAGDGFAIVQPSATGWSRWHTQDAEQVGVRYSEDDPDVIEVAYKIRRVGKRWVCTLYYNPIPDDAADEADALGTPWIERYATKGSTSEGAMPTGIKTWEPVGANDGLGAPMETLEGERIPLFHVPNDEVARYGRSVLTDVIPLQDALNKAWADLLVGMESVALPQRWGTGIQAQFDPATGEELALFKTGVERMLRTGSKDATFGQFPGEDMRQFLEIITAMRAEIGRKGYLPHYSVNPAAGDAPSGISLLVIEGRQVKRAMTAQRDVGHLLRELAAYCLTLDGTPCVASDLVIDWAPVETRDMKALLEELLLKMELGVPKETLMVEAGYTPGEASDWAEDDDTPSTAEALALARNTPVTGQVLPAPATVPAGAPEPAVP